MSVAIVSIADDACGGGTDRGRDRGPAQKRSVIAAVGPVARGAERRRKVLAHPHIMPHRRGLAPSKLEQLDARPAPVSVATTTMRVASGLDVRCRPRTRRDTVPAD